MIQLAKRTGHIYKLFALYSIASFFFMSASAWANQVLEVDQKSTLQQAQGNLIESTLAPIHSLDQDAKDVNLNDFDFTTRSWIKPEFNDIKAQVKVKRIKPRIFSVTYLFSEPLNPYGAANPTDLMRVSYCVNRYLAVKSGHTSVVSGFKKNAPDRILGLSQVEWFVGVLNEGESPNLLKLKGVGWDEMVYLASDFDQICTRIINPEYVPPIER